ncbi:GNAT family N-acetyltransferase [Clostridium sardiniense]|uniref:GNAT family N-acetyltransferase n=1 Tax=Clostridium sardiniense TaxID=29369 RepID=UPI003D34C3B0
MCSDKLNIKIEDAKAEEVPVDLLLVADPSIDAINKYINKSKVIVAKIENYIVGVIAFLEKENSVYEIMNLAVDEDYRRRGFAKRLIIKAEEYIKRLGGIRILIGTGNSSINQIKLYKNMGFIITDIKKNFFIENYKEEIYENNIQCRDMIILEKLL